VFGVFVFEFVLISVELVLNASPLSSNAIILDVFSYNLGVFTVEIIVNSVKFD